MYNKKVKLRALFLFLSIATLMLTIFLVLKALEENVVYFLSPTEIKNLKNSNSFKFFLKKKILLFKLVIEVIKIVNEIIKQNKRAKLPI